MTAAPAAPESVPAVFPAVAAPVSMRKRPKRFRRLRRRGGRSRTIRSRSSDGIHRTGSASGRSRRNGFLTDGRIPGNARRRVSVRGDCDGMLRTGRQIGVSADSDRGRDSRRSDPDHPVGPACGTHLHGRMSLRIEPPVESLVQGETVLFQHADAAYGQGLPSRTRSSQRPYTSCAACGASASDMPLAVSTRAISSTSDTPDVAG